jgi:hypothetical protein
LNKFSEHSFHAQNAMGLRVLLPIFEVLSENLLGGGGGREQRKGGVLDESQMMSQQLHLIGWYWEAASTIDPHHSQEIL